MSNKIWQSFGALNESKNHKKQVADEFSEDLPIEAADHGFLNAKAPRRDFLKYLGFSTAAASLAASCEMPVQKSIPFVNQPAESTPGIANWYASTFVQEGFVEPVLVKVRDGRPIKIEGNELNSYADGGTSARAQASVLDLYDTTRLRFPADIKEGSLTEVSTFEAFDRSVTRELGRLNGLPVVLLSGSLASPSSRQVIQDFLGRFPGSRHVVYDPISYSGMLDANEASYGRRAIPSYRFDVAKVVVGLGADFLGTWVSPVEFAQLYAKGRKFNEETMEMPKHYHFESIMSMTGANADERFVHKPSEASAVAAALLSAVQGSAVNLANAKLKAGIEKAANDLKAAGGAALVVCGSNDVNVQLVVNAINEAIGANGRTIDWNTPFTSRQGKDSDMHTLVADMNAGRVGALFILDTNPAYSYPNAQAFKEGLKKVKLKVSFSPKLDETTELCTMVIPNSHYLESWGDAEYKAGYLSFIQPTISPLFKTRQWQDSLLKWGGTPVAASAPADTTSTTAGTATNDSNDYLTYLRNFWTQRLGGKANWEKALRDGVVIPPTAGTAGGSGFNGGGVQAALAAIAALPKAGAGTWEVQFYEKVSMGSGAQASNPWLQEMPDPVTKATWDNYAMISAAAAKELLGIDITKSHEADRYEVHPKKPTLMITIGGKEIELPAMIVPGTEKNTIGIALGYGRSGKAGVAAKGAGKNAYPLLAMSSTGVASYHMPITKVAKTGNTYEIAQNQTHNVYEGRIEVVKETSLATLRKHPTMFKDQRDWLVRHYSKKSGDYRNEASLYDPRLNDRPGIHWGMSVDLNACNGCGACIVSCNAENNVPVVGKREVLRGHDMHWIRIDRYYLSDENNPDEVKDVVFMPMMCQHCDNAPCENVCPVAATNHSSEGLNQMTYNRCIGTRYCANNCPYKVRRFNWADYTGADSFPNNQVGHISDVTMDMNDDLTRMVLNPDVTVRARGVIEKCSFCVQRLQEGKLKAKKAGRPVIDGEIKVACQSACPTNAIVFGDSNDRDSKVSQERAHSPLRMYYALEQIHVLPNVNYMAKIRNTDEVLENTTAWMGEHSEGETGAETIPGNHE